jgi:ethanolamine ammonia-lyase small subunit
MTSAGPDDRTPHRVCVCNAGKGKTPTRASLNFDEHQGAARDSSVYSFAGAILGRRLGDAGILLVPAGILHHEVSLAAIAH